MSPKLETKKDEIGVRSENEQFLILVWKRHDTDSKRENVPIQYNTRSRYF
jgi:hypothetical protein